MTEWVGSGGGQPWGGSTLPRARPGQASEAALESAGPDLPGPGRGEPCGTGLARALKLKEAGLATQQAVADARTESDAAGATIGSGPCPDQGCPGRDAPARARQAKGLVTAPLDGVVAQTQRQRRRLASDAAAASPIFKIVDNRLLNLTVTVSSATRPGQVGQPLEFTVDALPGTRSAAG